MIRTFLVTVWVIGLSAIASDPPSQDWMKYAAPGENHKTLESLAGNWTYTSKWWADAKAKPETSKGATTSKMILGGRYLHEEVKGTAMGQAFEGISTMGYDNYKGEFQTTWIDNMGTGIMYGSGASKGKEINFAGTFACAMTHVKDRWYRTALNIKNKNEHTFAMFLKDEKGNEFKTMEMVYTRAKN